MRSRTGRAKFRGQDPFHGFGRLFDIEWLRLHDLRYEEVQHLRNPLFDDGPVHRSRDGQELANITGRKLCGLIDKHINEPEKFAAQPPPWQAPAPTGWPGAGPQGSHAFPGAKSRDDSSGSEGRRRKRRRDRKYRHAPHALEDGFDKQVAYFLSLDYEEYMEWWKRYGAVSPGPTQPP